MTNLPDAARGRLAVKPNPTRAKPRQYAIVSPAPLHSSQGLLGYKQGFGERHDGQWVYNFTNWQAAARVAHEVMASRRPVWGAE
jgi:hypothetical protein